MKTGVIDAESDIRVHAAPPAIGRVGEMIRRCTRALCVSACLVVFPLTHGFGQGTEPGYNFDIGRIAEQGAAAQVAVEEVVHPEKKGRLLRLPKAVLPIVRGISVRFERIHAAALDEIPAAVQALAKTTRVQMQRVAFFAPGDPVPRLMAAEAVVRSPGEWILKGVLLEGRPSVPECRLVWNKGEARLAFSKGKTLGFGELLAAKEVQ